MNSKYTHTDIESVSNFNQATSRRLSSLRDISRDQPDYWTALMNAFLVVCMLAALAICSWQVEDWKNTRVVSAQPAVADHGSTARSQHTF